MAKQKKEPISKPIEVTLWDAANKLRGSVEPSEYKHVRQHAKRHPNNNETKDLKVTE